jgi:hypothetical protein
MQVAIDRRQNVIGETMNHNSVPVVIGSPLPRTVAIAALYFPSYSLVLVKPA